jgi:ABC-type Co2+ transport system permease subunit
MIACAGKIKIYFMRSKIKILWTGVTGLVIFIVGEFFMPATSSSSRDNIYGNILVVLGIVLMVVMVATLLIRLAKKRLP